MFSIDHINVLRHAEFLAVLDLFPARGKILEIGAGTGQQALDLQAAGFEVSAIDLQASDYAMHRVFPVQEYDGTTIPFDDATFDVIYSSNTLEHVADLSALHREIMRVLRPTGVCVHIVPTHCWRLWTCVASVPALFQHLFRALRSPTWQNLFAAIRQCGVVVLQPRHGTRGHALTELWTFRPRYWRAHFTENGWVTQIERPVGIFYTGEMVLGPRLDLRKRATMARHVGSACHVFKLSRSGPSRA